MTLLSQRARLVTMTTGTGRSRVDDTREALLAAAHDLLATEGPAALTVRRIAAAAASAR